MLVLAQLSPMSPGSGRRVRRTSRTDNPFVAPVPCVERSPQEVQHVNKVCGWAIHRLALAALAVVKRAEQGPRVGRVVIFPLIPSPKECGIGHHRVLREVDH